MTGIHRSLGAALIGAIAVSLAPQVQAQSVDAGVEATTDEVRRGLSWSDGEVSGSADARVGFGGLDASLRLAMLRKSDRHANADAVADLALGKDWEAGAFTLRTEAIGHVFTNADSNMNYGELGLGARYSIGPLQVGGMAWYAPKQDNIGGDNLHLRATADAGLPGFPVSVFAALGYTTGDTQDSRSARLRPAGDYTDWKVGAEFNQFPFTFGVDYVGTDIDVAQTVSISPFADLKHAGDRVLARVRMSF
ncbi:MAG: TorF family putative porin [Novosphingobium sp.]|uniref:TorF family putative porin n=1 Tax=Novosphingobium sp. TaxID=1874826 RepID=UPI00273426AE|nr:TorF family putative porin [Novosphingobium sp.]MDP3551551.1 TorF family putative porin [Novosphingobium sp.]